MSYSPVAFEASSLSVTLRPTAESPLDSEPFSEYIPMTDNFAIRLEYFPDYKNYVLCFDGQGISEDMAYQNNSRIVINGEHVPRRNNTPDGAELFSIRPYNRCILVDFDPGLHLVEFHLRDSYFGEPIATQQWAIEIE